MSMHFYVSKIVCLFVLILLSNTANANTKFTAYVNDALGSPVVAINQAGDVIWRKTYEPYGKSSGNDGDNRIGYTGHVEDKPDLVYAGARYYDPALGRFLSDDPVRFTESNPMSFNRYAYANNNPYKYVDPDGRESVITINGPVLGNPFGHTAQGFNGAIQNLLCPAPEACELAKAGCKPYGRLNVRASIC